MVEIKNKGLKLYVQTVLNKNLKDFIEEDFNQFEVLSFDGNLESPNHLVELEDISYFPNVRKVILSDAYLDQKGIQFLKDRKISGLRLNRSALEDDTFLSSLSELESLELIGSYNESYDFLGSFPNLKYLAIVNPYTESPINLSVFEKTPMLEDVTLQRCILDDFSHLAMCKKIHYLNVLGSDVPTKPVETFNQMTSLKNLFISERHNVEGLNPDVVVRNNLHDALFDYEDRKSK